MPNFNIINGLAYMVESIDDQECFNDYTKYTFESARNCLISSENAIKECLLNHSSDITRTYSMIKSSPLYNDPTFFVGKIYSISEMLDSYGDYHSGMMDYMRLIGSLKSGDVPIDSVKEKLELATQNDHKLIRGISKIVSVPTDKQGRIACIRQIETAPHIVNTIHGYLDELSEIEGKLKSLCDSEFNEISGMAMNLICGSLTQFTTAVKSYFLADADVLKSLLNTNVKKPTVAPEGTLPRNAFKML